MPPAEPFDRVEAFAVTVAAGVLPAAPSSTDVSFAPGYVVGVEIIIPDGHLGLTGIALAAAHTAILPHTVGAFIVGNDEKIEWPLQHESNAGNWQALTYNSDVFPHTFQLRFLVVEIARRSQTSAVTPPLVL